MLGRIPKPIITAPVSLLILLSLAPASPVLSRDIMGEEDLKPLTTSEGTADHLMGLSKPQSSQWSWQTGGEDPAFGSMELEQETNIFQQILPSQVYETFFSGNPEPQENQWEKNNQGDYQRFSPKFSVPLYQD